MKAKQMAKVFYSDGSGNARATDPSIAPGWYYQIDLTTPVGPFSSKREARAACAGTNSCARRRPSRSCAVTNRALRDRIEDMLTAWAEVLKDEARAAKAGRASTYDPYDTADELLRDLEGLAAIVGREPKEATRHE